MKINSLTASQKQDLERLHGYEHNGRVQDRIKAVLLKMKAGITKRLPKD